MRGSKIRTSFNVASALLMLCSGILLYVSSYYVVNNYPVTTFNAVKVNKLLLRSSVKVTSSYDIVNVLPYYTQPLTMDTKWVSDLHHTVTQLPGRQVTLLVSNKNYLNVLINWLVHSILYAHHPIKTILIISFDTFTHLAVRRKGFHSVYIPPESIMKPLNFSSRFAHIWVTRLTVMRLLNYWNYSVLVFDSDAIMLRNIQPLLDKFNTSDIISSSGSYPFDLHRKWAVPTLCMGVFLIKSSPATGNSYCCKSPVTAHVCHVEVFWYMMESVYRGTDDQVRVNRALDGMGIQWRSLDKGYHEGITSNPTSLRVTTLPTTVICRYCKQRLIDHYYVWHHHAIRAGAVKRERLSATGFWLLQDDDWNVTVWNGITGEPWLLSISNSKS